jgi:hypothetical protein
VSELPRGIEAQHETAVPGQKESSENRERVAAPDFLPHHALCGKLKSKPMEIPKPSSACGESPSPHVSKQVYELTLADLGTFPVWEFRLDQESEADQDESTVRPYIAPVPLDPADRMFVVRAVFTLADGSKMQGYVTPPDRDNDGVGTWQPIVVTESGQVRFWCGTAAPSAKRLAHSYELLGRDATRVFPVRFESDVELANGPIRGSVPGFLVLEDFQTRRTRIVL